MSSVVTWYAPSSARRWAFSSSRPIDTQVSVTTTSAPETASTGSVRTRTEPPVDAAMRSASATTASDGT